MEDDTIGIYNQGQEKIGNKQYAEEGLIEARDALTLDIPDDEFIRVANKLVKDSEDFFDQQLHLKERREQNELYLFGRQLEKMKLKPYNARYVDNIIWESEAYLKPLALSKMPDITVIAGQDNDVSRAMADDLSKVITSDIQSRARRKVLGLAFKHLPVYFVGIIKYFWNPEKGDSGDYEFKVVHPENCVFDHTAASNDPNDMQFFAEYIEYSVKEWVMRFPDKEQEFYQKLHDTGIFSYTPGSKNENNDAGMNSKIKGVEIWFTWYDKVKGEYERIEGVAWYYKDLLFKKMKNPNWDWEGETQLFQYDQPVNEEIMIKALASGDFSGFRQQKVYHNHFANPEKPYILIGYDQWGKQPLDETSRIEQNIFKQQTLDKRGRQITEMLDRARGKHIFSSDEGMTAEDVENMDFNNPDEDLIVKGDVNKVHNFIPGEQPSPEMINDRMYLQQRIFASFGVNGPVRGETPPDDTTATQTQIAREGDFTRADDLTDDTINAAAEKMAHAILQMVRLRYTVDHFVKVLGEDGDTVFKRINQDMVEDGMELTITASGTDKLKAQQNAMDMAKLKMIDPLTYYKDMGMSDPKGRAEKLMLFMMQPLIYLQKFVGINGYASDLADALALQQAGGINQDATTALTQQQQSQGASPQSGAPQQPNQPGMPEQGGSPQALQDIAQIQQGHVPPVPNQIDPQYLQTFMAFMDKNNPNGVEAVLQQFPQIKQQLIAFAQGVAALARQGAQGGAKPVQPAPQGAIGPASVGNPNPQNTQHVNLSPI